MPDDTDMPYVQVAGTDGAILLQSDAPITGNEPAHTVIIPLNQAVWVAREIIQLAGSSGDLT